MRTPTTIPPKPNGAAPTKTKMVAFRFEDETKAKLEANARAANCTQTAMLKYLIDWYYDEHTSKIPRPAKRK